MDGHRPLVIAMAGPNGAGKSTTAPSLLTPVLPAHGHPDGYLSLRRSPGWLPSQISSNSPPSAILR